MSRLRDLAERQAALQLRCAVQRGQLAREVGNIEQRLESVDRATLAAKRVLRHPVVIALGVAVLAAIGPKRIGRAASRSVSYASRSAIALSVARRALALLRS